MNLREFFCAALIATASFCPLTAFAAPPVKIGDIEIAASFARATLPNAPVGGAYLTLTNSGTTPDTLVAAKSPNAGEVSLHAMSMDGAVMTMRDLPQGIDVPAGATVTMSPDGLHMMFEHLTQAFVQGKTVPVTLTFAKAGSVDIDIPVLGIAAKGPMQGMAM